MGPMHDPRSLGTLDVRKVEVHIAALPLVAHLDSAAASVRSVRPAAYVHVVGADGEEGWGECCALGAPTYTPESTSMSARLLVERFAPMVLDHGPIGAGEVRPVLDRCAVGWPMAKAAMEVAILDALLRRADLSLPDFLGAKRSRVPAGAAVGMPPAAEHDEAIELLVDEVRSRFAEGYRRVRVKIAPTYLGGNWTTAPISALRAAGVTGNLQVDGNMSYHAAHLDELSALADLGIRVVEQPFGLRRYMEHRTLRAKGRVLVGGDESIESLDDVRHAIEGVDRPFDVVCNKWSRMGGVLAAAAAIEECTRRGAQVFMGGMVALGRQVDLALASLIPDGVDAIGDHGPSGKWVDAAADPAAQRSWSPYGAGWMDVPSSVGAVDIAVDRVSQHRAADVAVIDGGRGRAVVATRWRRQGSPAEPLSFWP